MFAPPVPAFAPTVRFPFAPTSGNATRRFMPADSNPKKPAVFSFETPRQPAPRWGIETHAPSRVHNPPRAPDARRLHRRGVFLGNVRSRQDDARWESRGDQILQLDFARRQREWEALMARSAPAESGEAELDGGDDARAGRAGEMDVSVPEDPGQQPRTEEEQREIDALLGAEEEELEAVVRRHERERERAAHSSSPVYAEDDEFEDALCGLGVSDAQAGEAMDTT